MSERNPHLLYVITDLELGGVPLHLFRLARAMRDRGWRITVASLRACIKSPLPLGGEGWVRGKIRGYLDVSPSPQPSPLKGEGVLKYARSLPLQGGR